MDDNKCPMCEHDMGDKEICDFCHYVKGMLKPELKFDYRVIELKTTLKFDYVEEEEFEEFYLKLRQLCENHNVHMNAITRKEDILNYEDGK